MGNELEKVALGIAYLYYYFGPEAPNYDAQLSDIETYFAFLNNPSNNTRSNSLDLQKPNFYSIFNDKNIRNCIKNILFPDVLEFRQSNHIYKCCFLVPVFYDK